MWNEILIASLIVCVVVYIILEVMPITKYEQKKYKGTCPQCGAETEILYTGTVDQICWENCEFCGFKDTEVF